VRRALAAGGVALATAILLAGCFGPDPEVAIDQAADDFGALVAVASAADEAVLHTLEVEDPVSESCDTESDRQHTVYIAAGTLAVQADDTAAGELVDGFSGSFADERWSVVPNPPGDVQEAWVDTAGITATVTVDDGLLVIAGFSPCR